MLRRFSLLLGIALRHISKRKRQTLVAIAGVGIGVGFFLAVSARMIGSQNDFVETLMDAAPHIIISDEIRSSTPQPAVRACPDAADYGIQERFSCKMAIAPTASISIIAGNSSPGIEPIAANVFLQKTLSGSFTVRNRHLQKLLEAKGQDTPEIWSSITTNKGSVQHLDFLTEQEKAVYKTAFELDQRWIIEHAADRTPYICQSQSVNIFVPANVSKRDLHQIHLMAWKKGMKSLYYCRSMSIQRADAVSEKALRPEEFTGVLAADLPANDQGSLPLVARAGTTDYEEFLACQ